MKKQLDVHFHSNYSCNLRCKHCYNNSDALGDIGMPADIVVGLIKSLCEHFQPEIHLEGGEIFLRPELLRKLATLPDEILKCITITTNGTIYLEDSTIVSMLRRIYLLRISVEGHSDEQQMAIRGIGINDVLENARFYKENGVHVCLRITLNRLNRIGFASRTLTELYKIGFNNIQVYEFQKIGRGNENGNIFELDGDISDVLDDLIDCSDRLEGNFKIMLPRRRLNEIRKYEKKLLERKYEVYYFGGSEGVSIHADGEMFLCAWDNDVSHSLGNVMGMNGENFYDLLNRINLKHECEHCSEICIAKRK